MEKKRFSKINIEISNICNLQCSFCPEVIREKKIMDLKVFESIIQQVAPLTEQVCLHLMGDPLVHPKLEEIIQICDQYQTPIFFVTNAVLLKDRQSELLLHPIIRQVNFSLHSFFDNFPNRDSSEYLSRIFRFTKNAFERRPDLYINYRLWNLENTNHVSEKNIKMLDSICDHFQFSKQIVLNIKKQKSIKILNRLYLHFDTEFIWPSLDLPSLGTEGTCYGLKSHFGIHADGTVVPCCLDKEASIPLGNVNLTSISEIINSPKARSILQGFRERKLIQELCQKCQYIERFQQL